MFGESLALGFVVVVAKKLIDSFMWHFVLESDGGSCWFGFSNPCGLPTLRMLFGLAIAESV